MGALEDHPVVGTNDPEFAARKDVVIADWPYQRTLECALGVPFTTGNRISILKNGVEIFPAMLEAIKNAEHNIDFLTFIYWSGSIAREFAEALAEKARSGVRVNVLLDGVGAYPMPRELVDHLEGAGVQVRWFRPPVRWQMWKANYRTHRKILVCDGRVGFTGGVGIADVWEGDARKVDEWRETHFRIEGPAVHGLQAGFLENWAATGRLAADHFDTFSDVDRFDEDVPMQVIRSAPAIDWSDSMMAMHALLALARRRIRITTAYFIPDARLIHSFHLARRRGVEIDVLLPGPHTDERFCQLAGESEYAPMLKMGVQLWTYQPTMLHAKIMTLDDRIACIGSVNLNQRSMRRDDEIFIILEDQSIVSILDDHFQEDQQRCKPIDLSTWRKRSIVQRAKETVARQFRWHM